MAGRGVFFALDEADESKLLQAQGDEAVVSLIQEEIEERWDEAWLCETDKAWDAMHRCLSDGTLEPDGSPRSRLFLGGRSLHRGTEYVVNYLTPQQVHEAALAIHDLGEDWIRSRFATIGALGYEGPHDEEDLEYTLEYFFELREFVQKASNAKRPIVFTVDL